VNTYAGMRFPHLLDLLCRRSRPAVFGYGVRLEAGWASGQIRLLDEKMSTKLRVR
jgi:hypothetical protein